MKIKHSKSALCDFIQEPFLRQPTKLVLSVAEVRLEKPKNDVFVQKSLKPSKLNKEVRE